MAEGCVVDASAIVDLMLGTAPAAAVRARLEDTELHVPAHFDAEVLSALGRLHRSGQLAPRAVSARLEYLTTLPATRHTLEPLLGAAWRRRGDLRLTDALYAALAAELGVTIVTTDAAFAKACRAAELIRN